MKLNNLTNVFRKQGPTPAERDKDQPSTFKAGGKTFDSLASVGQAIQKDEVQFTDGKVQVREKAWQPDKAADIRTNSKRAFGAAGVFLGLTLAAASGPGAALTLPLMMGTLISGGVGEGMRKAANEFDKAPQNKELGSITQGPNGLNYQAWGNDTQKPLVTLE